MRIILFPPKSETFLHQTLNTMFLPTQDMQLDYNGGQLFVQKEAACSVPVGHVHITLIMLQIKTFLGHKHNSTRNSICFQQSDTIVNIHNDILRQDTFHSVMQAPHCTPMCICQSLIGRVRGTDR